MSLPIPENAAEHSIESLLQHLETAYYARIEALCGRAALQLAELRCADNPKTESLYNSLTQKLLGRIEHYLRLRRFGLTPYVRELLQKENTGHDCRSCTDICTGRHSAQIDSLRDSQNQIKEIFFRLHSVATPMYGTEMVQAAVYRALRAEMTQIDTALTELFYLEESSLIPKLLQAQKAIHAHS